MATSHGTRLTIHGVVTLTVACFFAVVALALLPAPAHAGHFPQYRIMRNRDHDEGTFRRVNCRWGWPKWCADCMVRRCEQECTAARGCAGFVVITKEREWVQGSRCCILKRYVDEDNTDFQRHRILGIKRHHHHGNHH